MGDRRTCRLELERDGQLDQIDNHRQVQFGAWVKEGITWDDGRKERLLNWFGNWPVGGICKALCIKITYNCLMGEPFEASYHVGTDVLVNHGILNSYAKKYMMILS